MHEVIVSESLKTLSQLAIGEGEHGIVFYLPETEDICGKYHKLGYSLNEYDMLVKAHAAKCSVPEPQGEYLSQKTFLMNLIHGPTIAHALSVGCRFSQEIVDDCVDIAEEFNQSFTHGDLYPRNMMLEKMDMVGGVIVSGYPVIIDLYLSRVAPSREWQTVRAWFRDRTAL